MDVQYRLKSDKSEIFGLDVAEKLALVVAYSVSHIITQDVLELATLRYANQIPETNLTYK